MCGDSDIGNSPKALCHNSSHFEAIEVLPPHLSEDSLQGVLDPCPSNRTEKHHLLFRCQEKEVPAGGTDLLIEAKPSRTLITLQFPKYGSHSSPRTSAIRRGCPSIRMVPVAVIRMLRILA